MFLLHQVVQTGTFAQTILPPGPHNILLLQKPQVLSQALWGRVVKHTNFPAIQKHASCGTQSPTYDLSGTEGLSLPLAIFPTFLPYNSMWDFLNLGFI